MQYEVNKALKKTRYRQKLPTFFPHKYPSYFVAFALKEKYDDLITAQQMICCKRSPQGSTNSITPTNSIKMFESEQTDKPNQLTNKPEAEIIDENCKNSPQDSINSMGSMTPTNSLKYFSSDDLSNASLITIGETENMMIDLSADVVDYDTDEHAMSQVCEYLKKNINKVENNIYNADLDTGELEQKCKNYEEDIIHCEIEEYTDKALGKHKQISVTNAENTNHYESKQYTDKVSEIEEQIDKALGKLKHVSVTDAENTNPCESEQYTDKVSEIEEQTDKALGKLKQVSVSNAENTNHCESEQYTDKIPEIRKFLVAENKSRDTQKNLVNYSPQAICKAAINNRIYKKKRVPKRQPKKIANIKQKNNFKHKNPHKIITYRLEKYYAQRKSIDAIQIQRELYSDKVSTVVSRTRVLHKIIARENLLEDSEYITFINDVGLNEYDNESLTSSLSVAKKSIVSTSSQNTLTQKSSVTTFKNEYDLSVDIVNSVIKISTENIPYKTDVINVAVAVAYNRSKVNTADETIHVPSKEKIMQLESLTSTEIATPFISDLTSNSPSHFEDFKSVTIEVSEGTLVNKNSSFGVSSDDFVIARTSSDFTRSSDESTDTLKKSSETVVNIETPRFNITDTFIKEKKPTFMETVINLGIYPEMTPSTSSDTPYEYDYNDVIIARNLNEIYPINSSKGDNKDQEIKNVLKKSVTPKEKAMYKTINLPNQAEIKALLKENDIPQIKCAEESRHPSYMPELWDRLVMTLELAVKRLEDNLVEKIIKELKNSLDSYPLPKDIPISEHKVDIDLNKQKIDQEKDVKPDADQGLQCDLVKNTIIDKIMQKLSSDGPRVIEPEAAIKSLHKSKLFKDFDILKPPETSQLMTDKGDTATVSTVTYEVSNFNRLKMLFAGPVNFVRENVFVVTSVPTFFVVLLFFYGMILLSMKPW